MTKVHGIRVDDSNTIHIVHPTEKTKTLCGLVRSIYCLDSIDDDYLNRYRLDIELPDGQLCSGCYDTANWAYQVDIGTRREIRRAMNDLKASARIKQ